MTHAQNTLPDSPHWFSLSLRRAVSVALVALVLLQSWQFPVGPEMLTFGLGFYAVLLALYPPAWLVVVPAALPVLDLSLWSGRILITEFDYLLAITFAMSLWHNQGWLPRWRMRYAVLALVFVLFQVLIGWTGYLALADISTGLADPEFGPLNAIRESKGLFWVLVLIPAFLQLKRRGEDVAHWLSAGMLAGLVLAILTILWERHLFTGIINFDNPYRISGWFFAMHTGGAAIDAYLTLAAPFVATVFFFWRATANNPLSVWLILAALYSLFVTFSRANYPAVAFMGLVFVWGLYQTHKEGVKLKGSKVLWLLILIVVLMMAGVMLKSQAIHARFSTTLEDLQTRFIHWNNTLESMDDDLVTALFGMGKGTFAHSYKKMLEKQNSHLADAQWQSDGRASWVKFSRSDQAGNLFLRQRFAKDVSGTYLVQLKVRNPSERKQRLLVEFCERQMLAFRAECNWVGINIPTTDKDWLSVQRKVRLPQQSGFSLGLFERPLDISIMNRGLAEGLDIGFVQLTSPQNIALLGNADFDQGMDHWFLSYGDHLRWHIKNLPLQLYYEGGLVGLLAFTLFLLWLLKHLFQLGSQGSLFHLVLLASFGAVLAVGLFDSVIDVPRISFLFFLLAGAAWIEPARQVSVGLDWSSKAQWARQWRNLRLATLVGLLLGAVAGIAAFYYYDRPLPFFLDKVAQKLDLRIPQAVKEVLRPEIPAPKAPRGTLKLAHPRLLNLPFEPRSESDRLTFWAQREVSYRELELWYPASCQGNSLLQSTVCWQVTNQAAAGKRVLEKLRSFKVQAVSKEGQYGDVWQYALAYDLLYHHPGMSRLLRQSIEARLEQALGYHLEALKAEGQSLWHGRATLSANAWLLAAVLSPTDESRAQKIDQAYAFFHELLRAIELTEAWPEGYNYWINARGFSVALAANAYLNAFERVPVENWVKKVIGRLAYWHLYAERPDNRIEPLADEGPRLDLKDETRRVIDLFAQVTQDPVLAVYSNKHLAQLHKHQSYYVHYRWGFWLFNDPEILIGSHLREQSWSEVAQNLPNFALFGKNAMNLAYFHSNWRKDETFWSFHAGASFTHHGHYDAGHFSLFKGAPLAVNSSTYDGNIFSQHRLNYAMRTVAKNSLLIMRPEERVQPNRFFTSNVSDGGQRLSLPTGSAIFSTEDWRSKLHNSPYLAAGKLLFADYQPDDYVYLAADLTQAYNTPEHDEGGEDGKVKRIVREFIYLIDEDRLLVQDQVRLTNRNFIPKWLLHTVDKPKLVAEQVLAGKPTDGIVQGNSPIADVITQASKLRIQRLLPVDGVTRLIGGPNYRYYVETDGDDRKLNGENMRGGANAQHGFDRADWRIESLARHKRRKQQLVHLLTPRRIDETFSNVAFRQSKNKGSWQLETDRGFLLWVDPSKTKTWAFVAGKPAKRALIFGLAPNQKVQLSSSLGLVSHQANSAGLLWLDALGADQETTLRLQ